MLIAAVVVTFRRREFVERTLLGLAQQTRPPEFVIVVDNGGDFEFDSARLTGAELLVLRTGENLGAAGGFAVGFGKALELGAEWILAMNDDDQPRPLALETLIRRVGSDHDIDSLAAITGLPCADGEERLVGARWDGRFLPAYTGTDDTEYEADVVTFTGALLSARFVARVGLPRADFFMMWEEHEFCLRLRAAGGRLVVVRTVLIDLQGHGREWVSAPWRAYYEARNGLVFLRAAKSPRPVATFIWFAARELRLLIASLTLSEPAKRIRLRLRGLVHGMRNITGRVVTPESTRA